MSTDGIIGRRAAPPSTPRCVVVAGMHRSGTSLTASLLHALGVNMGESLLPADGSNVKGYFEDVDFLRLHRRAFNQALPVQHEGHADWGWTPSTQIDAEMLGPWRDYARNLIAQRSARQVPWGFKDPRATPVLDFWDQLLPSASYVAVYRDPVRVAGSIQRLQAEPFTRNPGYPWAIWEFYNQRLVDFVVRHRDRCILVNIDALCEHVDRLPALLHERLNLACPVLELQRLISPELLRQGDSSVYRDALSRFVWDRCTDIYRRLESLADLPTSPAPTHHAVSLPFRFQSRTRQDELSIVIPTHNDAPWLVEAIASVEQHFPAQFEILVVDDGTTNPESLRIIDRLRAAGQAVHRIEASGLPAARNTLIAMAKGQCILPLDADNRMLAGFVDAALEALREDSTLGVVYGNRQFFGERCGIDHAPELDLKRMVRHNLIDACAVYRKAVWNSVGGYDTRMSCLEDWEFWLHTAKRGWRFLHLPVLAIEYRVRVHSLSRGGNIGERLGAARRLVWAKHADLLFEQSPRWVRRIAGANVHEGLRRKLVLQSYWRVLSWRGALGRSRHRANAGVAQMIVAASGRKKRC